MKDLPISAKVIAAVGVPSAIALYLVYWLTTGVASAANVATVDTKLDVHADRMEQMESTHSAQQEAQLRLLRLICISIAKTPSSAGECTR